MENGDKNRDAMIAEYQAGQADFIHNDNFAWTIGSVLIAGTFVFWGLLLENSPNGPKPEIVGTGSVWIALLLGIWILYAHHHRQIYLCKLQRMREIERELGMSLHLRWIRQPPDKNPVYEKYGLPGNVMNLMVFGVTALGIPIIQTVIEGFCWWYSLPMPVVIICLVTVLVNERRIRKRVTSIEERFEQAFEARETSK